MWNMENKNTTVAIKKICLLVFNALEHLCSKCLTWLVSIRVLGWIYRSHCLPCIPVSRKHWNTYAGSSPPTMLTHTFWVCKQKAKWTKDPAKETCYYLNWAAARRPDLGGCCGFIWIWPCVLDQQSPVSPKKKKSKSHGKLFEVSLTPGNPPVPPHAPHPTVGQRRDAVQRFCRMSHKWSKYTNKHMRISPKYALMGFVICGGGHREW